MISSMSQGVKITIITVLGGIREIDPPQGCILINWNSSMRA